MITTEMRPALDDPQVLQDMEAVMRHVYSGEPLDHEVAERVHERAVRITDEVYRTHGLIDDATFQALLDDDEA